MSYSFFHLTPVTPPPPRLTIDPATFAALVQAFQDAFDTFLEDRPGQCIGWNDIVHACACFTEGLLSEEDFTSLDDEDLDA